MRSRKNDQQVSDKIKKMNLKRFGIGLFCSFLLLNGIAVIALNWSDIRVQAAASAKQEYAQEPDLAHAIKGAASGIENAIMGDVFEEELYIDFVGLMDRLQGKRFIRDTDYSKNVVKDKQGYLHFISYPANQQTAAAKLVSINQQLAKQNIPLLYVQTPLKYKEGYTELPVSIADGSNVNANELLTYLEQGGVDVFDLREQADMSELDHGSMFYKTDHHWTNEIAFWAVGQVTDKLAKDYGLHLDPDRYYTDLSHYTLTTYSDVFLGSQGRRVGRYYAGVDDYTFIAPEFDTQYEVKIRKNDEISASSGSFDEAIVHSKALDMSASVWTNRYTAYFEGDYAEVIVNNQSAPNQTKLLIVKDSFALPFSAYLSTMTSELRMLDFRYFDQNQFDSYVQAYQPDAVIFLLSAASVLK